jgi:glycosyltransferase involved in cell wall biosynthesis
VIQHGLFKAPKPGDSLENKQSRARLHISQRDIVFSFIGAISEYKGVAVLLDAMRELFNAGIKTDIKLIIAGKARNAYMKYLLKKYRRVIYDKHILFINKRLSENELETILNAADFGICPYVNATTPATLLDFISHKLPIVTTDDRNVLSLIGEYPAIIAKRGDHVSLAHAISYACANVSEYREKAKNFKNMSSFIRAWRASADITLDCYLYLART